MRPVPAGRQRGQCCTPYSRLQEEIDNVETIAVTANNTANNAANAANTAVATANSAMAGLTDGSVTKIGTSTLGSDTKPIKLVGGVPTIVTNDLVDTATAQTVGGAKTYTGQQIATGQRAYDPANTDDIATIGTLDAYTPMVRTTGNQNIRGTKTFSGANFQSVEIKNTTDDNTDNTITSRFSSINFIDANGVRCGRIGYTHNGNYRSIVIRLFKSDGTYVDTTLASLSE